MFARTPVFSVLVPHLCKSTLGHTVAKAEDSGRFEVLHDPAGTCLMSLLFNGVPCGGEGEQMCKSARR